MNKLNVLKKCLNKRYIVINNQDLSTLSEGEAVDIINDTTLKLKFQDNKYKEVSIFDLRNPYHLI